MLTIRFGMSEDTVTAVASVFDTNYEEEWFNDNLVQQMIFDVDKSRVLSPYCIESPVLGQISPRDLSGGVKALILSLMTDMEIWATACGDNCAKWFLEIGNRKDAIISLEHYMVFPTMEFDFIDAATGELCHDYLKFVTKYWADHVKG